MAGYADPSSDKSVWLSSSSSGLYFLWHYTELGQLHFKFKCDMDVSTKQATSQKMEAKDGSKQGQKNERMRKQREARSTIINNLTSSQANKHEDVRDSTQTSHAIGVNAKPEQTDCDKREHFTNCSWAIFEILSRHVEILQQPIALSVKWANVLRRRSKFFGCGSLVLSFCLQGRLHVGQRTLFIRKSLRVVSTLAGWVFHHHQYLHY